MSTNLSNIVCKNMTTQKIYRSKEDKIIAGVCGGLGEYFDIDSTILRLGWVAVTVFSGIIPGTLIYIVAILIIPVSHKKGQSLQKTVIEVGGHTN